MPIYPNYFSFRLYKDLKPKETFTDNKIHSRTCRVKAAFSGKLRRASYTITNRASPVLPLNFQNLSTFTSPSPLMT